MKNNKVSEKYSVLFWVLLFLIPILALDASFYFLSNINEYWESREEEKNSIQEAERLASESDFNSQFSMLFRKYFEVIKSDLSINFDKKHFLSSHLGHTADMIFRKPFPEYNLYVFKKKSASDSAELLYHHGNLKSGKRGVSLAFDYIYDLSNSADSKFSEESKKNESSKSKKNESFAKSLLGQNSKIENIAKELRGTSIFTKSYGQFSWFIWNYDVIPGKGIIGAVLTCNEIKNHSEYGRSLALRDLAKRGRAIGAFIPIYEKLGKPMIQSPLDKSKIFMDWAEGLPAKNEGEYEKWAINDLPQGVKLGNYTAYCHLSKGNTHISVVLVKATKSFVWPKWLVFINALSVLFLVLVLACGLVFKSWPPIGLSLRFALSYILASILPLSLLSVTAYGYLLQYQNTAVNNAATELQSALKSFDAQKSASANDYMSVFSSVLKDERLIELIKERGINDELVAKRVVDLFENNDTDKYLPVLGVKILDESGEGAFARGGEPTVVDARSYIESMLTAYVGTLKDKLEEEDPTAKDWMKEYKDNAKGEFTRKAYAAFTGEMIDGKLYAYVSIPVSSKNGDFCSMTLYDYIKIDGKSRYILLVMWDDRSLDDKIIQSAFNNHALKNLKQNFMAFRLNGQTTSTIGNKTRHASSDVINKAEELAKLVSVAKRQDTYIDSENIIVAMPAENFRQSVLVGWVSKFDLFGDIFSRRLLLFLLLLFSIIILSICIIRSINIFLKPVNSLKVALDDVSNQNLNVKLETNSGDELGRLSKEFSNMIEGLREKERLSKLISDKAVQAIKKHSDSLLNDTETFYGVALVSDIRNFTGMSEEYDPTLITDLLNEHFAEMAKIISDNGGLVYKFIGDAIEAVFPENEKSEESASIRAFKAGCQMISKLSRINAKRVKKGLFIYRIGVGLCSGTMYSGSVGSLDTRLDYAILGEPLKLAAKFEGLSIQNPAFPVVLDENIADKMAPLGFGFKKLDNPDKEDRSAYTIDEIKNDILGKKDKFFIDSSSILDEQDKNDGKSDELKTYSLHAGTDKFEKVKTNVLTILVMLFVVYCSTVCTNLAYYTVRNSLKMASDVECSRLVVQLACDNAFRASFEAVCFDFFDDMAKVLTNKKPEEDLAVLAKPIEDKYLKLGREIPKYYCCKLEGFKIGPKDVAYKGFSQDNCDKIANIALSLKAKNDLNTTIKDKYSLKDSVKALMGPMATAFDMTTVFYRRAGSTAIDKEKLFVNTDMVFYPEKNKRGFYGYIFCAIPQKPEKDTFLKYCTALAGKSYLLALKSDSGWHFSDDFPDKEKVFLFENFGNKVALNDKGYYSESFTLGDEKFLAFAITKKLASCYCSKTLYNSVAIVVSFLVFGIAGFFVNKKIIISGESLAQKLGLYIFIAAVLPLLTVTFVSYIYVNEDYNVKKSDKYLSLQKHMDKIENMEYYYAPLCWQYIKDVANSAEIKELVNRVDNSSDKADKEKYQLDLKRFLSKKLAVSGVNIFSFNPYFVNREVMLLSKKGWAVSVVERNPDLESLKPSEFGSLMIEACKTAFMDMESSMDGENTVASAKGEFIVETIVESMDSAFGNEVGIKLMNFPTNPVLFGAIYSAASALVIPMPQIETPDYLILTVTFLNNEKLPKICSIKDSDVSIVQHIASGSVDDKIYGFFGSNITLGRHFFFDRAEDREVVKQVGLASSWVNTSNLPVVRDVVIHQPHLLVSRRGIQIGDSILAAFTSEIPIRKNAFGKVPYFVLIIFISVVMIYLVAKSVVSDLLAPIKSLMQGAKAASSGDYSFRTGYHRSDELGILCNSFDKMMKGLEEKEIMNRMVSKSALKVSSNTLDSDSKKINCFLLYVTVPDFAKIMGETPICDLFLKLRTHVATIAEMVIKEGGDIDKIMGEKLLIAFNVNEKTLKEAALTVCRVAAQIESSKELSYNVAVGVNYGVVISGFLGVGGKRDFTVIGDPVNVAARMATLAEKLEDNRCIISDSLYRLLANDEMAERHGEVALKGKSQTMLVYRLSKAVL